MSRNKTKTELKKLLSKVDFLSKPDKKNWTDLIETLNQEQLNDVYDHFLGQIKLTKEVKLKLITKHGFADKYLKNIEKLSRAFLKKANGI